MDLKTILEAHLKWYQSEEREGSRADLSGLDLRQESIRGARLFLATLNNVNLEGGDLQECVLVGSSMEGAILRGANLQQADLRDSNMKGADLTNADLRGANLHGATLWDVNLSGADLSCATGLTQEQLNFTVRDTTTKLPGDYSPQTGRDLAS